MISKEFENHAITLMPKAYGESIDGQVMITNCECARLYDIINGKPVSFSASNSGLIICFSGIKKPLREDFPDWIKEDIEKTYEEISRECAPRVRKLYDFARDIFDKYGPSLEGLFDSEEDKDESTVLEWDPW